MILLKSQLNSFKMGNILLKNVLMDYTLNIQYNWTSLSVQRTKALIVNLIRAMNIDVRSSPEYNKIVIALEYF